MLRKVLIALLALVLALGLALPMVIPVRADNPGAIWTADTGGTVNKNLYDHQPDYGVG